jgi:putative hemolysin
MSAPPLGSIAGAVGACLIAAVAFGGHVAHGHLAGGRLEGLAALGDERAETFRRFVEKADAIVARWLILRVGTIGAAAYLLAQQPDASDLVRLLWAVLGPAVLYGAMAEVFGSIARKRPEATLVRAHKFLQLCDWVTIPLAYPFRALGRWVGDRVEESGPVDARITDTQVEFAIRAGQRTGTLEAESAEMIRNMLEFKDLTIGEVMIPRAKVASIELDTPLAKVLEIASTDGHSRYPVYRETLDNVVGLLYVKDLFQCVRAGEMESRSLADLLRKEVLVTVESQSALSLLREMRSKRQHLAIVTDEFGGTEGIVTLEDVLEEIVGEIRDEYDTEAPMQKLAEGRFLVDASIALSDVEAHLGTALSSLKPEDQDFESLGGLIVHLEGKVPAQGTMLRMAGLRLVVREADEKRIIKVEILRDGARGSMASLSEEMK